MWKREKKPLSTKFDYWSSGSSHVHYGAASSDEHRRKLLEAQRQMLGAMRPPERPEPKELADRGLAIEPIVGWRSWTIVQEGAGWLLTSCTAATQWQPREALEASCARQDTDITAYSFSMAFLAPGYHEKSSLPMHDAPGDHCVCGVYAWKEESQSIPASAKHGVFGEVTLWGRVVTHARGYRAEYAYPKSLVIKGYAPKTSRRVADFLADAYGIAVEVR